MKREALLALITFIALWYFIPFAHELGHAIVCEAEGFNATIQILVTGEARATFCSGRPADPLITINHAAGGLLGAGVAAVPLLTRRAWIQAATIPFIFQNLLLAGLESMAFNWYSAPGNLLPTIIASALGIGLFLWLLFRLRLHRPREKEGLAAPDAAGDLNPFYHGTC